MSDDEVDLELLQLLRDRLGLSQPTQGQVSSDTGVLRDAEHIYNNAIDVSVDMYGTKAAAAEIYQAMQEKSYSTETWSQHELHPKMSEGFDEVEILNFVFTMDLLNFSFWSELPSAERFQVEYRGQRWTGYNSLVACLRRALDEDIPITTPRFWRSQRCSDETLARVFRSATAEQIPLLDQRISILREAADVLQQSFAGDDDDENDATTVQGARQEDDHAFSPDFNATSEFHESGAPLPELRAEVDGATPQIDAPRTEAADNAGNKSSDLQPPSGSPSQLDVANSNKASISPDRPELSTDAVVESGGIANAADDPRAFADNQLSTAHITQRNVQHLSEPHRQSRPDHAVARLVQRADRSAGKLVNLLAHHFPSFRDESRFEGRKVRLLKRAQIFAADLWAALNGLGLGEFNDIDHLTMFADYRVPQVLNSLGVLVYSPPLHHHIRTLGRIDSGHTWEVQLRGCSIWGVELIRREIVRTHPDATNVNAVLIDFFLYDLAKEREARAASDFPHHRTRSSNY